MITIKKTKTLLLWVLLWVFGVLVVTIRNKIAAGAGLEMGSLFFQNLILDVIVVPVSIVAYYVMKYIAIAVGIKDFLDGQKGLRNVTLVWFVLYIFVFLIPLFGR